MGEGCYRVVAALLALGALGVAVAILAVEGRSTAGEDIELCAAAIIMAPIFGIYAIGGNRLIERILSGLDDKLHK